jgi:archaellin
MYEYVEGKAMWANVSTPNTKFEPHKYGIVVLTDEDTATKLEGIGLSRVRTRDGQAKYDEPAFSFSRKVEKYDGTTNPAPKLVDVEGTSLDVNVGNGSEVTVKIKPYTGKYGTFAELIAVKVTDLVEYSEASSDNEEF